MEIKHDESYIRDKMRKLMEHGYGEKTVHSICFERYFSEEEREENRRAGESMSQEEWLQRCEALLKSFDAKLTEIMDVFKKKYDIHQVSEETSTMAHFTSNWDLHFWSNKGCASQHYMDFVRLSFNDERAVSENNRLLEEILELVKALDGYSNIRCRVQYTVCLDEERVHREAMAVGDSLVGKDFQYRGMTGKVKVITEDENRKVFGFFKKRARSRYYCLNDVDLLLCSL